MKALTLHQPWASLIALGVKTIETRSWSTRYRGPLAIHASKRESALHYLGWLEEHQGEAEPALEPFADRIVMVHAHRRGVIKAHHDLPLGAVVATATLVDCVPILAMDRCERADIGDLPYPRIESGIMSGFPDGWLDLYHATHGNPVDPFDGRSIPDQAPYGDFSPGRYAWLLDGIEPCDPTPARGKQGLWNWDSTQPAWETSQ